MPPPRVGGGSQSFALALAAKHYLLERPLSPMHVGPVSECGGGSRRFRIEIEKRWLSPPHSEIMLAIDQNLEPVCGRGDGISSPKSTVNARS